MSTEIENETNYTLPEAVMDAMFAFAADWRKNPVATDHEWDFVGGAFDGAESYYAARSLEIMRPGVVAQTFPKLKGADLVPVVDLQDPGAEEYTVTYETQAGDVRVSKDMKGIIPRVDLATSQETFAVYSILQAYGYSIQDIRAAMRNNRPLASQKAIRCHEQIMRSFDNILFNGRAEVGLKGLLNLATVTSYVAGNSQKFGTTAWGTFALPQKSPEEILNDLNGCQSDIYTATLESEEPDTYLLPTSLREHIAQRKVGDGTSESILKYFLANSAHIKDVQSSHKGNTSGSGGTMRIVAYEKNPTKVCAIVTQTFEQFDPFKSSASEIETTCHMRTAGVVTEKPASLRYMDISAT